MIVGGVITNQPLTNGTTPAARRSHRFASIDAEVSNVGCVRPCARDRQTTGAARLRSSEGCLPEAFKREDHGDRVPPEVGIFVALWEAKDVIDELSFTALAQNAVVGHVTASHAKVGFDSVVAVGPIGVLPDHQAKGIGSALMNALLSAADAQDVPLVVLLGSPQYYGRFGFRPAVELGVMPPEPSGAAPFKLDLYARTRRQSPDHSSTHPRSRPSSGQASFLNAGTGDSHPLSLSRTRRSTDPP